MKIVRIPTRLAYMLTTTKNETEVYLLQLIFWGSILPMLTKAEAKF